MHYATSVDRFKTEEDVKMEDVTLKLLLDLTKPYFYLISLKL